MKIAFINSVIGYGSTGRIVDDLAHIEGVEGKVYYGRKDNFTSSLALKVNTIPGNIKHLVSTFLVDNHGFVNKKETDLLISDLESFNPDLVHLHNIHGYYLNFELLISYLKKQSIPVVWTFHDCWNFTGGCAYYDSINCFKWQTECKLCPGLLKYPMTFNPLFTKRNYYQKKELLSDFYNCTIVTPSHWLKSEVDKSFLKGLPSMVIENGINLTNFSYQESDFRKKYQLENKVILLAVSSFWGNHKGLMHYAKVSRKLPSNVKLVMVGLFSFQETIFPSSVLCISRTNSVKELAELYSASDVFLNLTLEENFPTVNIESLACGLPIITYKTGGSPEIIDEKTGIVVEKGNIDEIISVINDLSTKPIPFKREDCIERAKRYNKERMLKEYGELYINLLKSKKGE